MKTIGVFYFTSRAEIKNKTDFFSKPLPQKEKSYTIYCYLSESSPDVSLTIVIFKSGFSLASPANKSE